MQAANALVRLARRGANLPEPGRLTDPAQTPADFL